jgi:phenylpropionate dioxygenase-like ring-hydroxylating dioxygenase large terminal subunit
LYMETKVEGGAGEGKCTEIPQLHANDGAARTRASPAACATAFPAAVSDGLLFVWMVPGADGLLQSSLCALSPLRLMHAPLFRLFQKAHRFT